MKNRIINTIMLTLMFVFITVITYAQMTLTGELRPRFEYNHGYHFSM